MNMSPEIVLNKLKDTINEVKNYHQLFNEANTKSAIIIPILEGLQWKTRSPFEVSREYNIGNGVVDYALKIRDEIKVLIEAKARSEDLSNYEDQIRKYAVDKNIYLFILTNGMRWQFYTWLRPGIGIHKFYDLDLKSHNIDFIVNEFYNILSKKCILNDTSFSYIRYIIAKDENKFSVYEAISEVWHNMLEGQHSSLCNLIIDKVYKKFQIVAKTEDVVKILTAYNYEFNKIRGTLKIPKDGKDVIDYRSDKLLKNLIGLTKLRGMTDIQLRDIMSRVSKFMNKAELEETLKFFVSEGFCEYTGKTITISENAIRYYEELINKKK